MKENFYVTTPIYYTNGIPHIGHSYSSIIADTIARNNKINGKKIKFCTGVDENSQKAVIAAEENGMPTMKYLDLMASKHRAVWDGLKIEYTDFIRTTESRHHEFVKSVLQKSFDNGDIYAGEYEGMYCVGCEGFKKDDDLVYLNKTTKETFPIKKEIKVSDNIIKVCPDHLTTPDTIKEKNYFFKLSKYQEELEKFYDENPKFVIPSDRFNEVKAFTKRGLEDFSISRETNKFGITLPFDEAQVTYVWYDALFNYLTVCQNGDEGFWPADLHVVGKDIIRFHAIYWPAMLISAGYELPKQILTTGFFTVDGQKISKSLGNVIDPVEFSETYSKDLLTLYLLSSFNIGQDGDFDQKQAILIYNAKLANNLGNLVNRVVVLTLKLALEDGLEGSDIILDPDLLIGKWENDYDFDSNMKTYNLKGALDHAFKYLDEINKYVDTNEPWQMIKDENKRDETKEVLYTIAEGLRQVGLSLYVFFPEKMGEMFIKLGLENYVEELEEGNLQKLRDATEVFHIKEKGEPLFKRFDV
ncbi:methionine--tRNA ligase [Candidatus Gracilibacteria bacterium 28_42_T64]|nr:methionine--tRNA ligase [Candidatus Gracilibacteria bacterium 28_42_T64]